MTKPLTRRLGNTRNVRPFWLLLATLGLAVLMGCNPAPQQPLRVATIPWPGYESIHLAQSLGYIAPQTIRLVEMPHSGQASMALRNASVDAAITINFSGSDVARLGSLDDAVRRLIDFLVSSKFYTTFSFLFGLGFAPSS